MSQEPNPSTISLKPLAVPLKGLSISNVLKLSAHKVAPLDAATSGSSGSGSPTSAFRELSISPFTPNLGFPKKVLRDDIQSATIKPRRNRGKDRWAFLNDEDTNPTELSNPLRLDIDRSDSSGNKFGADLYFRIEEFLDVEGLDIVVPSNDDANAKAKAAVRRLIISRTMSDNRGMSHETDSDSAEDGDSSSLSLRKNISCSTLARRRASASSCPQDLSFSEENTQVKKTITRDFGDVVEIPEEKETPSERSFIMSDLRNLGDINPSLEGLFPRKDSLGGFSELPSARSRKNSEILSNFLLSPAPQPQSLIKLSPAIKSFEFVLKPTTYRSPQIDTKKNVQQQANKTLSGMAKKLRGFEIREVVEKPVEKIASFAEILSNESESPFPESPDLC